MVYLFLADGFEEIEALTPVDLLRRAGVSVTTVGVTGKTVKGSHGIEVAADADAAEARGMLARTDMEMVVLPGGMPGTKNLDASQLVDAYLAAAAERGTFIAAICAAPMVLGRRGLLRGKRAVCYPGFEKYLDGAEVCTQHAVRDGKIITGQAMGAALPFALELVSALKGEKAAHDLGAAVLA